MKQRKQIGLMALLLGAASFTASAQTTFFTDTFASSTTNGPSIRTGSAVASSTSYDIASTKSTFSATNGTTIAPNKFHLALNAPTTSGFLEAQALFMTNGQNVALTAPGDFIEVSIVFTNSAGTVFNSSTAPVWIGLFNSGGALPASGGALATGTAPNTLSTNASSVYGTNNCAGWVGYVSTINSNGTSRILTRPAQTGAGTSSANQELVAGGFGSGGYANPGGTVIATLSPNAPVTLATSGAYTLDMRVYYTSATSQSISNFIFSGAGTGGSVLFSQGSTNVTGATLLTLAFDGLSVGAAGKLASPGANPIMDISSITVIGQSTPIAGAPTITSQPVPATVATGGSAIFSVTAVGSGVTYQWKRNNAPLSNGGHISGATTSQLLISTASGADAFSGANGYYCTITGTGNFSTNSATNDLTVVSPVALTWSGTASAIWDQNNALNWNSGSLPFINGDSVTFNDSASLTFITLSGSFLAPSGITVNSANTYSFTGSGSITGSGSLAYLGAGQLTMGSANTYSGGTLISNTTPGVQYVLLQNQSGLGTGPVVFANSGGTLEATSTGSATVGIGDTTVAEDFNIKTDGNGTFSMVILGELSGTPGKTLTMNPSTANTTNRYRVYGTNVVYNANLVVDNVSSATTMALYNGTVLAPYEASGTQNYNGIISGTGGIVQRGTGVTYLNSQNTYSGGTVPTTGTIGFGVDSTPTTGTVTSGPIGTGYLLIASEVGSASGTGTVLAAGGTRLIGNTLAYPSGTNNQTLQIGGTNDITFTAPFDLNGLDGITNTITSRLLSVTNTGATAFTATISDSASYFGLTKSGAGALYLNGANTYAGTTTNNAGLLAGSGSVAGSVVVNTNATIGGGKPSALGTFTIGGSLTLSNSGGYFRINPAGSLSDKVSVTGALSSTAAGTITVTNVGNTALVNGQSFALFNKAVTGGGALAVTGANAIWTNKLAVDGTIQVLQVVASTPGPISFDFTTPPTLKLSWPPNYLSWILQSNIAGLDTTNWSNITNSQTSTNYTTTINPARTNVYYRLKRPF